MTPKRRIDRLIFVFNAGSGSFNAFLDSARKLLQINGCTLCSITHGLAGEKSDWKECKEEIGVPVDYVHKDELWPALETAVHGKLPCVVAKAGDDLVLLLGPDVLDRCKGSVADLKGRLTVFSSMNGLELPQTMAE
jgi:hypothetical protein